MAIDVIDDKQIDTNKPPQTEEQKKLAVRAQDLFRASYNAKQNLELHSDWRIFDDYKHGFQNEPVNEEDPGSVTNIIHPIIESQIADLVNQPFAVEVEGEEVSDDLFAEQTRHMLEYVLFKNKFKTKLNYSEHDRLELGTTAIKVWFDHDALDGKGLPTFDVITPNNFFPDPKVDAAYRLQNAEFIIHAVARPLSYIRKRFPKMGKYVVRETSVPYNPEIFEGEDSENTDVITSEKALLLECYMKDKDGKVYTLHVANHILLEDSRTINKPKKDKYPFVAIPCYIQRGILWGQGDVELIIPTQDIINELDDQIRMTSRTMGNPQIVVGMGAGKGFDYNKWTNQPGLRVPMRDHTAWKVVPPVPISPDIPARREKAFEESNIISGRYDVNRGSAPGSGVTAASAIVALQHAGQKGVNHKQEQFKDGWGDVLQLLLEEIKDNWDTEMWVRIEGEKPDYKFYNPQKLNNVPIMIPNDNPAPNQDTITNLVDEKGKPMTRSARFDLRIRMGNGLPTDKTFIYQTILDLAKLQVEGKPVIFWKEIREYLKEQVGLPLESDEQQNQMPQGQIPLPQGQPQGQPPSNPIQQLLGQVGGGPNG